VAATASSGSSGSYHKSGSAAGVEEVECGEAAAATVAEVRLPAVLLLDHDRLATTKRRNKFFQDEIYNHVVRNLWELVAEEKGEKMREKNDRRARRKTCRCLIKMDF